jgi:hypothetical protein
VGEATLLWQPETRRERYPATATPLKATRPMTDLQHRSL